MSTYTAMIARIIGELKRSDLSAEAGSAIKTAIEFYKDQRFHFNEETECTITVSSNYNYYDLPEDFVEAINFKMHVTSYTYPLDPQPFEYIDSIDSNPNWKGRPVFYALYNNQMRLYPRPDQKYPMTLSYVKELTAVSSTSDSRWFVDAEDLIRHRAKADLLENVIRGPDAIKEAVVQRAREQEALDRLERKVVTRRSSGTIRPHY